MAEADERLVVMLEARVAEFERRMRRAEAQGTQTYRQLTRASREAAAQMNAELARSASRVSQSLAAVGGQVGALARTFSRALVGGAIGTAFAWLSSNVRRTIRDLADLQDAADRVGVSASEFQALQNGLRLAGVEAQQAQTALENFVQRLGDAAAGQGELARRLADAGISLHDSNGQMRDTLTLLEEYADAVRAAGSPQEQMAMTVDAFGKGGKALVLALAEGADGVRRMMDEARAAGTVLTDEAIAQAAALDDRWDRLTMRLQNLWRAGILEAAEYFGFVESNSAEMIAISAAETIAIQTDRIQQEAVALAQALESAAYQLQAMGEAAVSGELFALSSAIMRASNAFSVGAVSADDFRSELALQVLTAGDVAAELARIDAARFGGVGAALAGLGAQLNAVMQAAAAAAGAVWAIGAEAGPTDMESDARGRNADRRFVPAPGAPTVRPRPAPNDIDFGVPAGRGGGGGGGGSGRIDGLIRELQTEREIVTAWYQESLALLQQASDAELAAIGGKQEAIERLEREHQERLRQIQDEGQQSRLGDVSDFMGAMASVFEGGGRRMLRIAAVLQGAQAVINAWEAYTQVLRDPSFVGRPWARMAAAARVLAAGLKAAQAIRSAGGAGGGGGGGGKGGAADVPAQTGNEAPVQRIVVQGLRPTDLITGQMLHDMLMNEWKVRGAPVVELLR